MMLEAVRNDIFPYRELPTELSDCIITKLKPWLIEVIEPLETDAPAEAGPFCCYSQTVIFYKLPYTDDGTGNYDRWDELETRLRLDDVLNFEGDEFLISGGHIKRHNEKWVMSFSARRVEKRNQITGVLNV